MGIGKSEREWTLKTIWLNQLSWRSYAKLCTLISVCLGFALSITIALLAYLGNFDLSLHIGNFNVGGGLLTIVSVFVAPFIGGVTGFVLSLVTHPVFTLLLSWSSGLPLSGNWFDSQQRDGNG
jgi:hypothetical protein